MSCDCHESEGLTEEQVKEMKGEGRSDETEADASACSVGGKGDGNGGGDDGPGGPEPKKCFIAIEGIGSGDISIDDRDKIEKELVTMLLTAGYPVSDVRVGSEDNPIVEIVNHN